VGEPIEPAERYSFLAQDVQIQPEQIYTTAYWARADTQEGGSIALQLNWLDDQRQIIDTVGIWKKLDPDWKRYQMHVQAPEGAKYARFLVLVGGDQAAWFDDVCFAAGDDCP
jgi:hypothetical protein